MDNQFSLYLPTSPDATSRGFANSYSSLEEAIAAAKETPGALVEKPVIGGTSIVWEIPLDPEVVEKEAIAAAEALLPEGYEIVQV